MMCLSSSVKEMPWQEEHAKLGIKMTYQLWECSASEICKLHDTAQLQRVPCYDLYWVLTVVLKP